MTLGRLNYVGVATPWIPLPLAGGVRGGAVKLDPAFGHPLPRPLPQAGGGR